MRKYKDRAMGIGEPEVGLIESDYFFPKANPPKTIRATSQAEADAKLLENPQ